MSWVGEVAHELPGRLRIRVEAEPGDTALFDRLAEDVATAPGVLQVRPNPRACSLTVRGGDGVSLRVTLEQAGLFEFRAPRPRDAGARGLDRDTALAVLLSGLGLAQVARGEVTGSASENFWNAYRAEGHLGNRPFAMVLVGLGLIQLARGRWLNSATSLVFYALTARQLTRERE